MNIEDDRVLSKTKITLHLISLIPLGKRYFYVTPCGKVYFRRMIRYIANKMENYRLSKSLNSNYKFIKN